MAQGQFPFIFRIRIGFQNPKVKTTKSVPTVSTKVLSQRSNIALEGFKKLAEVQVIKQVS
jgi:hypothetical protein